MLYWMCKKTDMPLTGPQMEHAIRRNFGGLEDSSLDPVEIFRTKLKGKLNDNPDMSSIAIEVCHMYLRLYEPVIKGLDCS